MSRRRDPLSAAGRTLVLTGALAASLFGAAPAGALPGEGVPIEGGPAALAPADLVAAAMFQGRAPGPVVDVARPPPAAAAAPVDGFGAAVAENDLESMRGGFLVAEGITFDLGAVVRTLVDGELALSTTLNWTENGPQVSHQLGAGTVPATAEDLHAAAVLAGLDVEDLAGTDQVFLAEGGGTAFVHRINGADFQNIVVNTESGIEIRQETQVNLSLPGFDQTQRDWMLGLMGFRMNADMTSATAGAVGR